jgi:hypothetical protein
VCFSRNGHMREAVCKKSSTVGPQWIIRPLAASSNMREKLLIRMSLHIVSVHAQLCGAES